MHAGKARLGVGGESARHDLVELLGELGSVLRDARIVAAQHRLARLIFLIRREQPPHREQLPDHDAGREHVRALCQPFAAQLLGRHVAALALAALRCRFFDVLERGGDSEIQDARHAVGSDQHVGRRNIAMYQR